MLTGKSAVMVFPDKLSGVSSNAIGAVVIMLNVDPDIWYNVSVGFVSV